MLETNNILENYITYYIKDCCFRQQLYLNVAASRVRNLAANFLISANLASANTAKLAEIKKLTPY